MYTYYLPWYPLSYHYLWLVTNRSIACTCKNRNSVNVCGMLARKKLCNISYMIYKKLQVDTCFLPTYTHIQTPHCAYWITSKHKRNALSKQYIHVYIYTSTIRVDFSVALSVCVTSFLPIQMYKDSKMHYTKSHMYEHMQVYMYANFIYIYTWYSIIITIISHVTGELVYYV